MACMVYQRHDAPPPCTAPLVATDREFALYSAVICASWLHKSTRLKLVREPDNTVRETAETPSGRLSLTLMLTERILRVIRERQRE